MTKITDRNKAKNGRKNFTEKVLYHVTDFWGITIENQISAKSDKIK